MTPDDPPDPEPSSNPGTGLILFGLWIWAFGLFSLPFLPGLATLLFAVAVVRTSLRLRRNRNGRIAWALLAVPVLYVGLEGGHGIMDYLHGRARLEVVSYGIVSLPSQVDDEPTTRIQTRSTGGGCVVGTHGSGTGPGLTPYWDMVRFLCVVIGPMPGHYRGPYPRKSEWCRLLADEGVRVSGRDLDEGRVRPHGEPLAADPRAIAIFEFPPGKSPDTYYDLLPLGETGLLIQAVRVHDEDTTVLIDLENRRVVARATPGRCNPTPGATHRTRPGWLLPAPGTERP